MNPSVHYKVLRIRSQEDTVASSRLLWECEKDTVLVTNKATNLCSVK